MRKAAKALWQAVFGAAPSATAQRMGLAIYTRKAERDAAYREWSERFGGPRLAGHYGHYTVEDSFAIEHLKSQLYELTTTLRRRLGPLPAATRALDAGASDGLFLEVLGIRRGVGLNIMLECARNVAKDGYAACLADLGALPFRSGAFDVAICCETLEHLPDPIQGSARWGASAGGGSASAFPGSPGPGSPGPPRGATGRTASTSSSSTGRTSRPSPRWPASRPCTTRWCGSSRARATRRWS